MQLAEKTKAPSHLQMERERRRLGQVRKSFAAVIDHFAIDPRTKAGHLSHGQRAGLHLAMTLAIEPEVLMLDDPATGLDPAARRC